MAEPQLPIKVTKLTHLNVVIGDRTITLSLAKLSSVSTEQHLKNVFADLSRKVGKVTPLEHHTVLGHNGLVDETLLQIFTETYGVKYENDDFWQGPWRNTTGSIELVDPDLVAKPTSKAVGAQKKKGRRASKASKQA